MFMDFLGECMDEVANQMAKMRVHVWRCHHPSGDHVNDGRAGMSLAAPA